MIGMRCSSRPCALALAFLLPTLAVGELALHVRESSTGSAIESRHEQNCVRLHDHRICTLVQRSPWAPTATPLWTADGGSHDLDAPAAAHAPHRRPDPHPSLPRAPPPTLT